MKTSNSFWDVVANYNEATWEFQIFLLVLGAILVVITLFRPNKLNMAVLKGYLAFGFGWLAVAFFWLRDPSPVGRFFGGPLFAAIAVLLVYDLWAQRIRFHFPGSVKGRVGMLIGMAVFLTYPLVSLVFGHNFPRIVTPMMPCPFTVLGLVLLTASLPESNSKVLALLLVWAAVGIPKMFGLFDVREDTLLVLVGLSAAWIWLKNYHLSTGTASG